MKIIVFCVNYKLWEFKRYFFKEKRKEKIICSGMCHIYYSYSKLTYCILFPLFNQKTNWCCLQYIIVICARVLIYVCYFTACAHIYVSIMVHICMHVSSCALCVYTNIYRIKMRKRNLYHPSLTCNIKALICRSYCLLLLRN